MARPSLISSSSIYLTADFFISDAQANLFHLRKALARHPDKFWLSVGFYGYRS